MLAGRLTPTGASTGPPPSNSKALLGGPFATARTRRASQVRESFRCQSRVQVGNVRRAVRQERWSDGGQSGTDLVANAPRCCFQIVAVLAHGNPSGMVARHQVRVVPCAARTFVTLRFLQIKLEPDPNKTGKYRLRSRAWLDRANKNIENLLFFSAFLLTTSLHIADAYQTLWTSRQAHHRQSGDCLSLR
jgi:hypothetical protein